MGSTPRTTVELEPGLYRALKRRARGSQRSLTRLVNKALREALHEAIRREARARGRRLSREDVADIAALLERRHEKGRPFDEFVEELKRDGLL